MRRFTEKSHGLILRAPASRRLAISVFIVAQRLMPALTAG